MQLYPTGRRRDAAGVPSAEDRHDRTTLVQAVGGSRAPDLLSVRRCLLDQGERLGRLAMGERAGRLTDAADEAPERSQEALDRGVIAGGLGDGRELREARGRDAVQLGHRGRNALGAALGAGVLRAQS